MGLTLYIFDNLQKVRKILVDGIAKLVHTEEDDTLDATLQINTKIRPGEYLGFECVDKSFRLFRIDEAEEDDEEGLTYAKATDAAVAELSGLVVENLLLKDKTAEQAVRAVVDGFGWEIGTVETGNKKKTSRMYYHTVWEGLQELSDLYKMRVAARYDFANGALLNKKIDLLKDEGEFAGVFYEADRNAQGIVVTYTGHPITRLYGLGKSTGTQEEPKHATIADAVWKTQDGDPANKPQGQTWVEDAVAVAAFGRHAAVYQNEEIEDPEELLEATWEDLQKAKMPQVKATASLADMEQVTGDKRKRVRLGDLVHIIPKHGPQLTARIVGIARDYIEPDRTKVEIGSEDDSLTKQVANLARGAVHTKETMTLYSNQFKHDEELIQLNAALIQMNAEAIQMNADSILAQADQIALVAGDLKDQYAAIVVLQDQIRLKADKIDLEGFVTVDGVLEALANATIQGSLYVENTLDAYTVNASECSLHNVTIDGNNAGWKSDSVLTELPGVDFTSTTFTFVDGNGNNRTIVVPVSATLVGGGVKTVRYVGR